MWPTGSRLTAFLRSRTIASQFLKNKSSVGALSTPCKRSDFIVVDPPRHLKAQRNITHWSPSFCVLGIGSGTPRFLYSTDASDAGGSEKGGVSDSTGEGETTSAGEGEVSVSANGSSGETSSGEEKEEEEENRWWENVPKPRRMRRRERHGRYTEDIEDEISSFPLDDSLTHLYNARAIVEEYMKNTTDAGMVPPEFLTEEGLKALAAELQAEEQMMEEAVAGQQGEEVGEEGEEGEGGSGLGERAAGSVGSQTDEGREGGEGGEGGEGEGDGEEEEGEGGGEEGERREREGRSPVVLEGESREFLEGLKGVIGELSEQAVEGSDSDDPSGDGPILRWETRMVLGPGGDAWHPANRKVKVSVNVKEIGLSVLARERLLALVGRRYNVNKDELTIVSERYAQREENRKDVYRTLLELLEDAKTADELAQEVGDVPQLNNASDFA